MHEHGSTFWEEYVHIQFDPAHILAEFGFTIFFDLVIIALLLPIASRCLNSFKKTLHKELDAEHGIPEHE